MIFIPFCKGGGMVLLYILWIWNQNDGSASQAFIQWCEGTKFAWRRHDFGIWDQIPTAPLLLASSEGARPSTLANWNPGTCTWGWQSIDLGFCFRYRAFWVLGLATSWLLGPVLDGPINNQVVKIQCRAALVGLPSTGDRKIPGQGNLHLPPTGDFKFCARQLWLGCLSFPALGSLSQSCLTWGLKSPVGEALGSPSAPCLWPRQMISWFLVMGPFQTSVWLGLRTDNQLTHVKFKAPYKWTIEFSTS